MSPGMSVIGRTPRRTPRRKWHRVAAWLVLVFFLLFLLLRRGRLW
jgi:hypothetical protein